MSEHDHLIAMLNRLKLTALRDQLDSLIDEAGRDEETALLSRTKKHGLAMGEDKRRGVSSSCRRGVNS
jgi:hypothetical protein